METEERVAQICAPIYRLSDEILLNICRFLPPEDTVRLAQTCWKFNTLLCDRQIVNTEDTGTGLSVHLRRLSSNQTLPVYSLRVQMQEMSLSFKSWKINWECAYSLSFNDFHWFSKPRIRCENVRSLSLGHVYWLTSGQILRIAGHMHSLQCLLVHDTQLSMNNLSEILSSCKLIKHLSWTAVLPRKGQKMKEVRELANCMSSLQSLFLILKHYDITALSVLLEKCVSLEELRMCNVMNISEAISDLVGVPSPIGSVSFPNLHSLVVTMSRRFTENWIDFRLLFVRVLSNVQTWRVLWADPQIVPSTRDERVLLPFKVQNAEALSVSLRDIPEEGVKSIVSKKSLKRLSMDKSYGEQLDKNLILTDSSITHLEWHNFVFPATLPESLEHFNLRCRHQSTGILSSPLLRLTHLSLASCVALLPREVPSESASQNNYTPKKRRRSLVNREVKDCILKDFTMIAPNVRELEIRCEMHCRNVIPPQCYGSLLHICNWPQLESLFLDFVKLVDISILSEIAQSCPNLRRLGVINVGNMSHWSGNKDLIYAIHSLNHLEDFRFGHPNIGNAAKLIDALAKCPTLRRVAVISRGNTATVGLKMFLDLVGRCERLIFLLVRLSGITQKMEKDFRKEAKIRFATSRPSLWAYIEGTKDPKSPHLCPDIHYRQMVEDPSCLSIEPPPFVPQV